MHDENFILSPPDDRFICQLHFSVSTSQLAVMSSGPVSGRASEMLVNS